nr:hypothetical protein [Tanacetum cinerariifolium]
MGTIPMCVYAQESWGEGMGVLAGKLGKVLFRSTGEAVERGGILAGKLGT